MSAKPKYKMVQRQQPNTGWTTNGSMTTSASSLAYFEMVPIGWLRWKLWLMRCPLWSKP